MKQFIAHRGNTEGKQPAFENTIEYLNHAYDLCGGLECDIRTHNGELYFGHDEPQELVDTNIIMQDNWFCHAKDLEALGLLLQMNANCFWHQTDTVTLTSKGFIWCYPDIYVIDPRAVWVDFEDKFANLNTIGGYGLCSDRLPVPYSQSPCKS
tara:strand:+ start:135 stop:593 length:459 start_codon:yes stop_codon:yes gene_type:complete